MNVMLEVIVLLFRLFYYCLEASYRLLVSPAEKSIRGQVALVTGGGRGIGQCIALRLAQRGASVAVWDIDESGCKDTVRLIREAGGTAYGYKCDVSDVSVVREVAAKLYSDLGQVDILINNAGVGPLKMITELSDDEIRRTINVNLVSNFWTIREFLPAMIQQQKGHIVGIASALGVITSHHLTDYCSTKFGLHGLNDALVDDLRHMKVKGIQVTTVYPMAVDTKLLSAEEGRIKYRGRFDKMISPDEVGDAVLDGVLHNRRYVFIPGSGIALSFVAMYPAKAISALKDFIGSGFFEVNKTK